MRELSYQVLVDTVKELFKQANFHLPVDVKKALHEAEVIETNPLAKEILGMINANVEIAAEGDLPLCQDTGLAVIFAEIGEEVRLDKGSYTEAFKQGVRESYEENYLRKSVVDTPLTRVNTKDNTPCIIHYDLVPGDKVKLSVMPKGFGSENMSGLKMLKPADGEQGVIDFVVDLVIKAGGNPCPPVIVGVGLGGTAEKATLLAKQSLLRPIDDYSPDDQLARMEREIYRKLNESGVGPQGLGGDTTCLAVKINSFPTHIAGLPVAVNLVCHSARHAEREL